MVCQIFPVGLFHSLLHVGFIPTLSRKQDRLPYHWAVLPRVANWSIRCKVSNMSDSVVLGLIVHMRRHVTPCKTVDVRNAKPSFTMLCTSSRWKALSPSVCRKHTTAICAGVTISQPGM